MNENAEKLKDMAEDLEHFAREHADALANAPTVAHPFHQAKDEARRLFKIKTEAHG